MSVSPSTKEARYLIEHGASGLQLQQMSPSHPPVSAAFHAGVRGLCTIKQLLFIKADLELLSPEVTACFHTRLPLSFSLSLHSVSTGHRPQSLVGIGGYPPAGPHLGVMVSWSSVDGPAVGDLDFSSNVAEL